MYIQTAYDLYDLTKLVVQRHRFEQLSLHLYIHRKYSCRKITRNYTFDYSQAHQKILLPFFPWPTNGIEPNRD